MPIDSNPVPALLAATQVFDVGDRSPTSFSVPRDDRAGTLFPSDENFTELDPSDCPSRSGLWGGCVAVVGFGGGQARLRGGLAATVRPRGWLHASGHRGVA